MKGEFVELIGKEHTLRVLFALRATSPQRFGELERALDVNPAQLDRALKWLQERLYILATTTPKRGRSIVAMYELGQRGAAFLDAFDSFVQGADKRRDVLGEKPVRELITLTT